MGGGGLQNLVLAIGSIAVLALPMLLGVIPLWVAVACHEGSTLLVVLNSLRLLRAPKPGVHLAGPSASSRQAAAQEQPCKVTVNCDPLSRLEGGGLAGVGDATTLPLQGSMPFPAPAA